ncbi:hypothetical protein ACH4E5_21370 [Streptomyces afghaniensis]|uniref:hypothetical protein n=1 Tax=Streptomyces afghaniensis TaxID=66865 RepID=UPI003797CACB
MAKVLITLVWAAVLVLANKLLDSTQWAQYAVTFALGGIYAFIMSKAGFFPSRDTKPTSEESKT